MHFVSFAFLALFLIVFACRLTIGRRKTGWPYLGVLLTASLVFYAWHIPAYLPILLGSSSVDYLAGLYLGREGRAAPRRRLVLTLSLVTNLGLLFFFKYFDFFARESAALLDLLGWSVSAPVLGLALPMGVSFYTFQSMSYTIDVYRGHLPAYRSPWKFLLFVSFFPQLMAGPIVRAKEFLYQIDRPRRVRMVSLFEGSYLVVRGFFLKMVVADNLGIVVGRFWERASEPGVPSAVAVAVTVLFSFQIFCDFAGYSSVARGLGYLLGFRLPVNFNSPYIADSLQTFWRRWHITLGAWLRDYLYVSLGGNRRGPRRALLNLFLVMFLGGLWHGAANTFVVWGVIHGLALGAERLLGVQRLEGRGARFGWYLVTQLVVLVAWVFFRADDTAQAAAILANALRFDGGLPAPFPVWTCLALLVPPVLIHVRTYLVENHACSAPGRVERALTTAAMLYATLTCFGVNNDFIYFQF